MYSFEPIPVLNGCTFKMPSLSSSYLTEKNMKNLFISKNVGAKAIKEFTLVKLNTCSRFYVFSKLEIDGIPTFSYKTASEFFKYTRILLNSTFCLPQFDEKCSAWYRQKFWIYWCGIQCNVRIKLSVALVASKKICASVEWLHF